MASMNTRSGRNNSEGSNDNATGIAELFTQIVAHLDARRTNAGEEQETVTGTVLEAIDRELEEISANNYTLKCANQESQARERARDQTIETTSAMIRELQRRIDETSGKP
ncbi:hypothetical protein CTI12_AA303690 [Artemisia annua]|uniref:Uncharacterized protein n=1 Tax=Artemisia annua TaxID=35608 RepID=A0A2U1N637_ARTAN|nr:hypothetical protein CTI12_AA303690 [Artemisia annua]